MIRIGLATWLLSLLAAVAVVPWPASAETAAPVDVEVIRDGDDWTAHFTFHIAAPAWAFEHSALTREGGNPWRLQSWTVETPGVRIERHGWYDVLVSESGDVPQQVRVRFAPNDEHLQAAYDAALIFSNGAVALFSDQFNAMPLGSAAESKKLLVDHDDLRVTPARVTFRDKGDMVLHGGKRHSALTVAGAETYVLFGPAKRIADDGMAAIIDPGLPGWLAEELALTIPKLLSSYADRLGPLGQVEPTVMVSWTGPTPELISMGGGVLPGLVVMSFEGVGVLERNPGVLERAHWFIAHEAAHLWLGQAVDYDSSRHAWMMEGGADLLAIRAIAAWTPSYDARAELQSRIDECISLVSGEGLNGAAERSEHQAYYACGAAFGLVAEAAAGKDFFAFWRGLIDSNRDDGVVGQEEWLGELTRLSGDPSLAADIWRMAETGVADPASVLASLFDRSGVAFRSGPDGAPHLL